MGKIVSFDLEISKDPNGVTDWAAEGNLGISCIQYRTSVDGVRGERVTYPRVNGDRANVYESADVVFDPEVFPGGTLRLSREAVSEFVLDLKALANDGYIIVSVNGLGFDFKVLAEESNFPNVCAQLAYHNHADFCFASVCNKGWRTGLQAFSVGAELAGKKKSVVLNSGDVMEHMDGGAAPALWAQEEFAAVLSYLDDDVDMTLGVAEVAVERGLIRWQSGSGKQYVIDVSGTLPTVKECMQWPIPYTPWINPPILREDFLAWAMPYLRGDS